MSLSRTEIFNQYSSLKKTIHLLRERRDDVLSVLSHSTRFAFFGCGSSYSLAKSAAAAATLYGADGAFSLAAGDFIVNFEQYKKALTGTCAVFISRSGKTSEMLIAAEILRNWDINCTIVALCATEKAPVSGFADLSIELSWAFDNSVCQTQTVSNLYVASLLLLALHYKDTALEQELLNIVEKGDAFLASLPKQIEPLYEAPWERAVVLADGVSAGIAEEGALAFNELCVLPSNFYHVLDVRHGPMVLIGKGTLVVLLCSASENTRQLALLNDLKHRGAYTLVVAEDDAFTEADTLIKLPRCGCAVGGLLLINVIQLLALGIANSRGVDPDNPDGLDSWIKL